MSQTPAKPPDPEQPKDAERPGFRSYFDLLEEKYAGDETPKPAFQPKEAGPTAQRKTPLPPRPPQLSAKTKPRKRRHWGFAGVALLGLTLFALVWMWISPGKTPDSAFSTGASSATDVAPGPEAPELDLAEIPKPPSQTIDFQQAEDRPDAPTRFAELENEPAEAPQAIEVSFPELAGGRRPGNQSGSAQRVTAPQPAPQPSRTDPSTSRQTPPQITEIRRAQDPTPPPPTASEPAPAQPTAPQPTPTQPTATQPTANDFEPAEKIFAPQPAYPESARQRGEQGLVVLEATVTANGDVRDARVIRGISPVLDQTALTTFRTWQFQPARRSSRPVSSQYRLAFRFALDEPTAASDPLVAEVDDARAEKIATARGAPPPAEASAEPLPWQGDFTPPSRFYSPLPTYPQSAWATGTRGTVTLQIVVDREGRVTQIDVLEGLAHGISEAAVEAVRQWQFRPATRDGSPVSVYHRLSLRFAP